MTQLLFEVQNEGEVVDASVTKAARIDSVAFQKEIDFKSSRNVTYTVVDSSKVETAFDSRKQFALYVRNKFRREDLSSVEVTSAVKKLVVEASGMSKFLNGLKTLEYVKPNPNQITLFPTRNYFN